MGSSGLFFDVLILAGSQPIVKLPGIRHLA
jgi:hypothetical protein